MALQLTQQPAPRINLQDENGQPLPLEEVWGLGTTALLLLRHFG